MARSPGRQGPFAGPVAGRRSLGAALLGLAVPGGAGAQEAGYPNRLVRLIVPYPPGGSVDPVARVLSQKLTDLWGQRVIIDNRPGASTIIGTEAVARAPKDGYTLLFTASTHVTNSLLFKDLPYDYLRDFAPVATVYKAEFVLVANPVIPANTLQEFIAYARERPNEISYASAGAGNASHIAAEVFGRMTDVRMQHVPYRGGGPLVTDLLRGDVQLYFAVPPAVQPHIHAGRLKAYATTAEARLPLLPEVPTFAEAGLPGFGIRSWIGVWAPAGTPQPAVEKASADIGHVLSMPDVRAQLEGQGQVPFISTPPQMAALIADDAESFGRAIREAHIEIER